MNYLSFMIMNFSDKLDKQILFKRLKLVLEQLSNESLIFIECNTANKDSLLSKLKAVEKILSDMDLIYNFSIYKFDNRNNFYKIIFNGTPDKFLEVMSDQNYDFEIKNKIWVLNDRS